MVSKHFSLLIFSAVVAVISPTYGEAFSFAIIADPHVSGNPDNRARFETAIDWIVSNKDSKNIELTFVLGDIAWGGSRGNRNLDTAKKILDRLSDNGITYVPIIGDNEVQYGGEREFQEVFGPHFNMLSGTLDNCRKAFVPAAGKYLQNLSFDYKDCHFVCADFISRKAGDEGGELHDFAGGSWPWFKNDIERCPKPKDENVIIMTHIGMFNTGFDFADKYVFTKDQMDKIKSFLNGYKDNIDSNYAGHLHLNWYVPVWSELFTPLYYVRVTDETWSKAQWPESEDFGLTIRWVQVDNSGTKISYRQHIVNISEEGPVQR